MMGVSLQGRLLIRICEGNPAPVCVVMLEALGC